MDVENALYPTQERIQALFADTGSDPVVMVNLLKFRDKALYADGRASDLTGRQAYGLYGEPMRKIVEREGGKMIFAGDATGLVIGEVGEMWDMVALMAYPSAAAFARIATAEEVAAIGVHRAAGLAGQILIRTKARA